MQFINRVRSAFQRIKYTFQRFCDKIKALDKKKERISRFLGNDIHQKAFSRLIRETKRLLKRLRPKRASVDITFGFEDPAPYRIHAGRDQSDLPCDRRVHLPDTGL